MSPPGPVRRAAAPGQTAIRRHCRSRGPGLRGRPGSAGRNLLPGKRPTCRVCYTPPASAATASGDVAAGHRGRIADMTSLMLSADLAAVSSLPLVDQRATSSLATMRCGSRANSPQPGGAEQPILVPLLRWSSLCTGRIACDAPAGSRFVPSAGRDLVAGRVVPLEAEPTGWTWQQGPGQRARSAGGTGLGSRRPQRQPDGAHGASEARPASEPLRLVEPQQVQARGYRRQSLPFSAACLINGRVVTCSCRSRSAVLI